jgi:hypothetical protein
LVAAATTQIQGPGPFSILCWHRKLARLKEEREGKESSDFFGLFARFLALPGFLQTLKSKPACHTPLQDKPISVILLEMVLDCALLNVKDFMRKETAAIRGK